MKRLIRIAAPAKVNLTLDVFGKRDDGFHDIDSIVVPLAPADILTITVSTTLSGGDPIVLHCDDESLPTGSGNLAYRAAEAFVLRVREARSSHIAIRLTKRLPFEAGLGGGSSDAASVLRGLATIFTVDPFVLREIAASIGSDVPLFLEQSPVRVTGRGEIVAKLEERMPKLCGVLVKPAVGVPTGAAYALLDELPLRNSSSTANLMRLLVSKPDVSEIAAALHNDFEAAIFPAFPPVAEAHAEVLEAGALGAILCGSGSAIFGLARDKTHANELATRLRTRFPYVSCAENNVEPLDAE